MAVPDQERRWLHGQWWNDQRRGRWLDWRTDERRRSDPRRGWHRIQITVPSSQAGDLTRGAYNTTLNCDSHDNFDAITGENADGIDAKLAFGPGNLIRGCRSWNNSWVANAAAARARCPRSADGTVTAESSANQSGSSSRRRCSFQSPPLVIRGASPDRFFR